MAHERYEIIDHEFVVEDPELSLQVQEPLGKRVVDYFPNQTPSSICYYKKKELDGPSSFFSHSGQLLCETWYLQGKKVGKLRRYYPSAQLYCVERYVEGKKHLLQEYYYPDGRIKTEVNYVYGTIQGKVALYWPDGQLKRLCQFEGGVVQTEQFFTEEGRELGSIYRI